MSPILNLIFQLVVVIALAAAGIICLLAFREEVRHWRRQADAEVRQAYAEEDRKQAEVAAEFRRAAKYSRAIVAPIEFTPEQMAKFEREFHKIMDEQKSRNAPMHWVSATITTPVETKYFEPTPMPGWTCAHCGGHAQRYSKISERQECAGCSAPA